VTSLGEQSRGFLVRCRSAILELTVVMGLANILMLDYSQIYLIPDIVVYETLHIGRGLYAGRRRKCASGAHWASIAERFVCS